MKTTLKTLKDIINSDMLSRRTKLIQLILRIGDFEAELQEIFPKEFGIFVAQNEGKIIDGTILIPFSFKLLKEILDE